MRLGRRFFLKICAALGVAGLTRRVEAMAPATLGAHGPSEPDDGYAVLVDTTRCVGCRSCELACSQANGLPEPLDPGEDGVLAEPRSTSPTRLTVVNRARGHGEERFAKTQCLHCLVPACATACPVRAFEKTAEGPVVYHPERCIGCRYCMVACPFGVPKYEYDKTVPYVRKCSMCATRLATGQAPACVEACPGGALSFGRRPEIVLEARRRVYAPDSAYYPHIFGENEAGGTSWLYIGDRRPSELGLDETVGNRPAYELTRSALGAVPLVITLWPPLLMGLYAAARRRDEVRSAEATHEEDEDV